MTTNTMVTTLLLRMFMLSSLWHVASCAHLATATAGDALVHMSPSNNNNVPPLLNNNNPVVMHRRLLASAELDDDAVGDKDQELPNVAATDDEEEEEEESEEPMREEEMENTGDETVEHLGWVDADQPDDGNDEDDIAAQERDLEPEEDEDEENDVVGQHEREEYEDEEEDEFEADRLAGDDQFAENTNEGDDEQGEEAVDDLANDPDQDEDEDGMEQGDDRYKAEEEEDEEEDEELPPIGEDENDGDDYVNPQAPLAVTFERAGANKKRQHKIDTLKPELKTKLKERRDEKLKPQKKAGLFRRKDKNKNMPPPPPPPRRKPEAPHMGATDTMKAFQPGTKEFLERREEVLKNVEQTKGKRARIAIQQKLEELDKRRAVGAIGGAPASTHGANARITPYTKTLPKPKVVEKVPIVKRLVKKMGYEESLMLDTTLSFLYGLRYGVFRSSDPLTLTKKRALMDWFELLSVSLPQEWGLVEIVEDFADNIDAIAQSDLSLIELIDKHKQPRIEWSPSCKPSGKSASKSGVTCGFWKLLHVSTIGLAEHRGGQTLIQSGIRNAQTRTFTPKDAAETIKNYIEHFYPCGSCSKQFVAEYHDCNLFNRCDRLADDASVTDEDWKELGTWLWEVHNHINVRAVQERARKENNKLFGAVSAAQGGSVDHEIAALWPTVDQCVQCFNDDGSWNEDAVFLYLERVFWPPAVLDPQSARLLKFDNEFDPQGHSAFMFLAFVGLVLVVVMKQSLSKKSIDHAVAMARKAMIPKGSVGAKKRAV